MMQTLLWTSHKAEERSRFFYPTLTQLILLHCFLWCVLSWFTRIGLDSAGDMLETYAWGQQFNWGSFKHPPLFGWITGLWFWLIPQTHMGYFILSYINVALGLWGILNIARLFQKKEDDPQDRVVWWSIAFSLLTFPYANLAAKMNADTILLSLWPWTAYFFLLSLREQSPHPYRTAIELGIMAAISILGKYTSALLLVTLFIISLSQPTYRSWYFRPYPYMAFITLCLVLLPHAWWVIHMDFPFMMYLEKKLWVHPSAIKLLSFSLSGLYYLLPAWIMAGYLVFHQRKLNPSIKAALVMGWSKKSKTNDQETFYTLVLLSILPAFMTCLLGGMGFVRLTGHWAIPLWFALPIFMATTLRPLITTQATLLFWRCLKVIWIGTVIITCGYLVFIIYKGKAKQFLAREEMALAIQDAWYQQMPGKPLFEWAGGIWPEPAALAFYLPHHPRALPGFPDQKPALINPEPTWETNNGVLICHPAQFGPASTDYQECLDKTQEWLKTHHQKILKTEIFYQSTDWRAFYAPQRQVTIFWYLAP